MTVSSLELFVTQGAGVSPVRIAERPSVASPTKAATMEYMSEAEFWRDCPAAQIDPDKLGGRPTVGPYRLAAQDVAEIAEYGATAEEIADQFEGTPVEDIRAVLSYYAAHKPQLAPSR